MLYLAKSGLKCPIWPYSVFMATGVFSQGQATVLLFYTIFWILFLAPIFGDSGAGDSSF